MSLCLLRAKTLPAVTVVQKIKRKNKKDQYAFTITKGNDYKDKHGTIVCRHCGKAGHGKMNCWELHRKPERKGGKGSDKDRECWICGSNKHISWNCPKRKDGQSGDKDGKAKINAFFVNVVSTNNDDSVNDEDGKKYWCCKKMKHTKGDFPPLNDGNENQAEMGNNDESKESPS